MTLQSKLRRYKEYLKIGREDLALKEARHPEVKAALETEAAAEKPEKKETLKKSK